MESIFLGVLVFTSVVLALVGVILLARNSLVNTGAVKIMVNGQKEIEVPAGGKLMGALGEAGILVSSACGGGGTCAQCVVKVHSCLLYTSPSPRDATLSRMPSSA